MNWVLPNDFRWIQWKNEASKDLILREFSEFNEGSSLFRENPNDIGIWLKINLAWGNRQQLMGM